MTSFEDVIRRLKRQQSEDIDTEVAHQIADDIICEFLVSLGYEDVVAEYNLVGKWYAQGDRGGYEKFS